MFSGVGKVAKGIAAMAFAAALILPSAAMAQETELQPYVPAEGISGAIEADGSSTVGPVIEALAEEFAPIQQDVQITVNISGTGGGFTRFCDGETDLQNASREIRETEIESCIANGVEYFVFEMAYDGISVVVNKENDFVSCLTVDQLGQLWAPDSTVTTWADLNPEWPAEEISLYGPGPSSGTFDYFTGVVNGEEGVSRSDFTPSEDDNVLVAGVSGDANALGYFGFAYYEQNADSLNLVAIDNGNGCVLPSQETIGDLSYDALSRPLFIYVNAASLARPEVQEFIRFSIATAPSIVGEVGYVPSPAQIYVDDQARLEAAIAGEIGPDGPAAEATPSS
ncbi:MAG: PstS family phosphate ABC transporter substrate-binding protein [Thermomicrobiales bacterium]|nr:PstS family phosphate ABC transporter substrate-binding protein [Thermomicrobiales bacterium]